MIIPSRVGGVKQNELDPSFGQSCGLVQHREPQYLRSCCDLGERLEWDSWLETYLWPKSCFGQSSVSHIR